MAATDQRTQSDQISAELARLERQSASALIEAEPGIDGFRVIITYDVAAQRMVDDDTTAQTISNLLRCEIDRVLRHASTDAWDFESDEETATLTLYYADGGDC